MRAQALLIVLTAAVVIAVALAGSAAQALPPQPIPTCSPAPDDCSAWHTTNVTVTWSTPSCPSVAITSDTSGTPVSCTASDGSGSVSTTVIVRRDATPPSVRGKPARGPDSNGWYNGPLAVEFEGGDSLSGISSCSTERYAGPDSGSARVSGTCTDFAGNRGTGALEIKYDATAPTAAPKPERNPNARGWYNRPVSVGFAGTDPVSGVDSCTAPVVYKGPDTTKASFSGTCRDKAANTSAPAAFELRYDSAAPALKRVKVGVETKGVVLRWTASTDSYSFAIIRRPGLRGKKPSTIYTGRAHTFVDRRLENGVKYRYTVTAYDEAGNGAAKELVALPRSVRTVPTRSTPTRATPTRTVPALVRPGPGARLSAPPLLTWGVVPKATYYNVQLYRDGEKILSSWTKHPKLRLQKTWKYAGRSYVLTPGVYRWFVWPGFALPSANEYGKLVGSRTFVVTRR